LSLKTILSGDFPFLPADLYHVGLSSRNYSKKRSNETVLPFRFVEKLCCAEKKRIKNEKEQPSQHIGAVVDILKIFQATTTLEDFHSFRCQDRKESK